MPQQVSQSIENMFTGGLKTEYTGMNFPEHAATDTDNCVYSLVGNVNRRLGFDYEANYSTTAITRTNKAMATYKWNNVGGDSTTQLIVTQVGSTLYFYKSSAATVAAPLSTKILVSTVTLTSFLPTGVATDPSTIECQFTDGNGCLYVFHPMLESFYCTFAADVITATIINIQIRDFTGLPESGVANNNRPSSLTAEHTYNLLNQGWTSSSAWSCNSNSLQATTLGLHTFPITSESSNTVTNGDQVTGISQSGSVNVVYWTGNVTAYTAGISVTINLTSFVNTSGAGTSSSWAFTKVNAGLLTTWNTQVGGYPSNSDVWWNYKNSSGVFAPSTTYQNVTANAGYAPRGHYILPPFNQDRTTVSGTAGLTPIMTNVRPKTGVWFQGRVWYAGVDASQAATGDAPYTSWSENIYFSQVIQDNSQLGMCYQVNDPTSETLFGLLPTDGGVVTVQSCGSIYKLFPIQNGLLVFAANGIYFITGSQGIGFTANDYTVNKISDIQSISSYSFVNVQGLPYFWNEEGIYTVTPTQQGIGLTVEPITVSTILSFYNEIPVKSKIYARGAYNPIDYVLTFVYNSEEETDITSRYNFNRVLNYNTYNKAFYPYTIEGAPHIHGINYVSSPNTVAAPDPTFKFLTSRSGLFTFSEERDDTYVDFKSVDSVGTNFDSYFVTGYKLKGQGQRKFQPSYVYMYSQTEEPTAYSIQGIWDYATSGNSGKYTQKQFSYLEKPYSGMIIKRHKMRGQGLVLQLKVDSVPGMPFDIIGWAVWETVNQGV